MVKYTLSVFYHFRGLELIGLMAGENPLVVTVSVLHLVLAKLADCHFIKIISLVLNRGNHPQVLQKRKF